MGYVRTRSIPPSTTGTTAAIVSDPAGGSSGTNRGRDSTNKSSRQGRSQSIAPGNHASTRRGRSCHRGRSLRRNHSSRSTSQSNHSVRRRHHAQERSRSKSAHSRRTSHSRTTTAASSDASNHGMRNEAAPVRTKSLHRRVSAHGSRANAAQEQPPSSKSMHGRGSMQETTGADTSSSRRTGTTPKRTCSDDGTCGGNSRPRGRSLTAKQSSKRSSLSSCSPTTATSRRSTAAATTDRRNLPRTKSSSKLVDFDPMDNVEIQPDITCGTTIRPGSTTSLTSAVSISFHNSSNNNLNKEKPCLKREQMSNALYSASLSKAPFPTISRLSCEAGDTSMPRKIQRSCSASILTMSNNTSSGTSTRLARLYKDQKLISQTTLAVLAIASNICNDDETGISKILDQDKLRRDSNTLKLLQSKRVPRRSASSNTMTPYTSSTMMMMMTDQSMYSHSTATTAATSTSGSSATTTSTSSSKSVEETAKRMKGLQHRFRRSSQLQEQLAKDISQDEQERLIKGIAMLPRHVPSKSIMVDHHHQQQQATMPCIMSSSSSSTQTGTTAIAKSA